MQKTNLLPTMDSLNKLLTARYNGRSININESAKLVLLSTWIHVCNTRNLLTVNAVEYIKTHDTYIEAGFPHEYYLNLLTDIGLIKQVSLNENTGYLIALEQSEINNNMQNKNLIPSVQALDNLLEQNNERLQFIITPMLKLILINLWSYIHNNDNIQKKDAMNYIDNLVISRDKSSETKMYSGTYIQILFTLGLIDLPHSDKDIIHLTYNQSKVNDIIDIKLSEEAKAMLATHQEEMTVTLGFRPTVDQAIKHLYRLAYPNGHKLRTWESQQRYINSQFIDHFNPTGPFNSYSNNPPYNGYPFNRTGNPNNPNMSHQFPTMEKRFNYPTTPNVGQEETTDSPNHCHTNIKM